MTYTDHLFHEGTSGGLMVLRMPSPGDGRPYDGTHGVVHAGCDRLAEVSPELDCFYCSDCGRQGRISGAWFMDLWTRDPEQSDTEPVRSDPLGSDESTPRGGA